MMNQLGINLLILSIFFFYHVRAQTQSTPSSQDVVSNFQPSLVVVIGILGLMFSLTFILLIFAKVCHRRQLLPLSDDQNNQFPTLMRSRSRFSGIDKTAIESLPFFKFSSLKGSKEGLECSICLSKFEDIEILRLLPKCKHAFHIDCIDHWLEKHSSCPICRHKVNIEDQTTFAYSNSLRMLVSEESNIEIFVQREEENDQHGSSRFSIGSSFRKFGKGNTKEEELLIQKGTKEESDLIEHNHTCQCRIDTGHAINQKCQCYRAYHKHNHQITISDVVFKHRWSNVSSSDLMFLNSEMINATSSNRFNNMESKISFESKVSGNFSHVEKYVNNHHDGEKRSVSEITAVSRFRDLDMKKRVIEDSSLVENKLREEKLRKLWFPIVRRTTEWFVNREKRSQQSFVDV
ncbi:RING/U-box superfamily protein [Trifolium repens]|nr:RING/U-box superfamily protein [Trifolium repens]